MACAVSTSGDSGAGSAPRVLRRKLQLQGSLQPASAPHPSQSVKETHSGEGKAGASLGVASLEMCGSCRVWQNSGVLGTKEAQAGLLLAGGLAGKPELMTLRWLWRSLSI